MSRVTGDDLEIKGGLTVRGINVPEKIYSFKRPLRFTISRTYETDHLGPGIERLVEDVTTLRNRRLDGLLEVPDWDELLTELAGTIHRLASDGRIEAHTGEESPPIV
jgi:hypothetical protein